MDLLGKNYMKNLQLANVGFGAGASRDHISPETISNNSDKLECLVGHSKLVLRKRTDNPDTIRENCPDTLISTNPDMCPQLSEIEQ